MKLFAFLAAAMFAVPTAADLRVCSNQTSTLHIDGNPLDIFSPNTRGLTNCGEDGYVTSGGVPLPVTMYSHDDTVGAITMLVNAFDLEDPGGPGSCTTTQPFYIEFRYPNNGFGGFDPDGPAVIASATGGSAGCDTPQFVDPFFNRIRCEHRGPVNNTLGVPELVLIWDLDNIGDGINVYDPGTIHIERMWQGAWDASVQSCGNNGNTVLAGTEEPASNRLQLGYLIVDDSSDFDHDFIAFDDDNCRLVLNRSQRDWNGNGYGNACDADLNNDTVYDTQDLAIMQAHLQVSYDQASDMDCNGAADTADLTLFLDEWAGGQGSLGPSGLDCAGEPNCNVPGLLCPIQAVGGILSP